jgi:hypothetical protein
LENPEEMGTSNPPKYSHEGLENLNRPIMSNEIEMVIKVLPRKTSPRLDGITAEF